MAKIRFTGGVHTERVIQDNPEATARAHELAMLHEGHITVHVEPRCDEGTLDWTVSLASISGRSSVRLYQQTPLSAVTIRQIP